MRHVIRSLLLLTFVLAPLAGHCGETASSLQSRVNPASPAIRSYPKIVLYSVAWCPHCKAAKEYFTTNDIPFINRDVELDAAAMDELVNKYRSQGVPVIVIGADEVVLKGFDRETFEKGVREVGAKK